MAASVSPLYTSQVAPPQALQSFAGQEVVVYGGLSRLEVTTSSTHDAFRGHRAAAPPATFSPPPRVPVPFEGTSSYSLDYKRHPVSPPPAQLVPPPRVAAPFEGCSTTHAAFVPHPPQPAACSPRPPPRQPVPFEGISTTKASFPGHAIAPRRPSVGIATLGDRFHVLIPGAAPTPTSASQVFTTVHDGQRTVCFLIFQGEAPLASSNQLLGQFTLGPLPPAPAGSLKIRVTFYLDQAGWLTAKAQDTESGQEYQWTLQRQG